MKNLIILISMILPGLKGCDTSVTAEELSNAKWTLQTLNGDTIRLTDKDNKIFIEFDHTAQRVNGSGGCNRFFGNYEQDGTKLKFSPMGATRMSCPDLKTENEFYKTLEEVDSFSLKDDELSFKSKGKVVAVFLMDKEKK